MKKLGLNHVAVAVKDLPSAIAFYEEVLGLTCEHRERVEDQAVDAAIFGKGQGRIELISPFTPDSGVAKFLEKRGEGLHHLCIDVPDLEQALAEMKARGLPLIDETPRIGAGGSKIAFVHPKGGRGVLIELRQAD
ncbi:MAG: methylmalonyl-CoA epimerase [Deltaproteobacteria bacterium]